jgi:hypothetical protein
MDAEYLAEENRESSLISLGPDSKNEALTQFLENHLYKYFRTKVIDQVLLSFPTDASFKGR